MRRLTMSIFLASLTSVFCVPVQGQIVLEIESGQMVTVGAEITLSASIRAMFGAAVLTNYNLPVDVGADEFGLPAGVSVVSLQSENPDFSNFAFTQTPGVPFNFDFTTSDSGEGIELSTSPTELFSITLQVDPGFQAGDSIAVAFQESPTPNQGLFAVTINGTTSNDVDMLLPGILGTRALILGDVNLDEIVNLLDVAPFIDRLGSSTYQIEADANQDGIVNLLDVDGFIELIASGGI